MTENKAVLEMEKKWRERWAKEDIYKFHPEKPNKFYLLEMFSYPSGAKLHLGHWWNYGLSDSYGRFKRLKGFEVFQPMGFDAFGLPAENYAIKTGIHPKDSTEHNMAVMENQLKNMGATFNWEYEVKTCEENYYRWTQWLFTKLYENGLAYQKYAPVNWCTSCNTTLANEQVVDGKCERCGSQVIRKDLTQWFFKITAYAEQLLEGLNRIDWPERTKTLQKNWIGKSVGSEVDFDLENGKKITVFTSRIDTLFGVSWLVLAPELPVVKELTKKEQKEAVEKYIKQTASKDEIERQNTTTEKTGVFTGSYAINPINGKKVPIYIADYVLGSYATGAVMGVAAHDERDFDFALKYNVPVIQVIKSKDGSLGTLPFTDYGMLMESAEFDGMTSEEAKSKITKKLETLGKGRFKTNYKFRDWSVSRQRYWGCPIPVVHCEKCGIVAVPEKDLPVKLPYNVDWTPDGRSPLSKNEEFMNCTCPKCGGKARRDPDTLDTFVCSTWYQFRYPSAKINDEMFSSEIVNKMCPVDKYVGGIEHATMHLLYSRFITKFLKDIGKIDFDEPFASLVHQGMILGSDGQKMSKSRGNTVSADDIISEYGSDALRLYLMFGFNYTDGGPWNDEGIKSIAKFIERFSRVVLSFGKAKLENETVYGKEEKELDRVRNYSISEVEKGMEVFAFNTSIARMMELVNAMNKYELNEIKNGFLMREIAKDFLIMIAPCAPHLSEELWEQIGMPFSIHNQKYPTWNKDKLVLDEIEIAVQIRSKIVVRIVVSTSATQDEIEAVAKENPKVKEALSTFVSHKTILIPNRLINFV
ncbi:MAG: leucine--tRNA ligase [Clostridia bacterium]